MSVMSPVYPRLRTYHCTAANGRNGPMHKVAALQPAARGARAERPVTDREDSDSGVAKSTRSTSALFGVQRMIKHIKIICGPVP